MNIIGLILGLGVLFVDAESFVAYDCNNAYSSYIKYDAVNLKKCSLDNDWIAKEEDVDIQVIQEKYEDTIEVHTCTVTKTIEIGKCGWFDSLVYGIPYYPVQDEPVRLNSRQCKRLVEDHVLEFMDNELKVKSLGSFSFDVTMFGTRREPNGRCWNAQAFEYDGKYYPSNYIVGRLKGQVTKRQIQFNPSDNLLKLDGKPVHLRQSSYEGKLSTYLWREKRIQCLQSIEEVYFGPARLYIPSKESQNRQILVNDPFTGTTFGLEVSEAYDVCGTNLYRTQLSNMFVTWKKENFVRNIDRSRKVDRLDNIVGLLSHNYVSQTKVYSDAIREIALNTCENSRNIVKTKIEMIRRHPESGILDIFGVGYDSIVMGSSIIVWKCDPITVELNQNLDYDTVDIPVIWSQNGIQNIGYADNRSMKLKNSSKIYPKNRILHPSYFINGSWYCRGNGKRIILCESPRQFEVDVSVMKEALDQLHNETVHQGGFNDEASRAEFRKLVHQHSYTMDTMLGFGTKVALKDVDGIEETFGLQTIKEKLLSGLYDQLWKNPFSYKLLAVLGAIILFIISWFFKTWNNISKVRKIRKEEDSENPELNVKKFSKYNYFYAVVSHNTMAVNVNARKIEKLEKLNDFLSGELQRVFIRLERGDRSDIDRIEPPTYEDSVLRIEKE